MNLRIKFAKVCRQILTPIRQYLITRKILKRVKGDFPKDKKEVCFIYGKKADGSRPFGVLVRSGIGKHTTGLALRCGCWARTQYYWGNHFLADMIKEHERASSIPLLTFKHGSELSVDTSAPTPTPQPRTRRVRG